MPYILLRNLQGRRVSAPAGTPVLRALQNDYVDWMHACGGKGRCTTCKMRVLTGLTSLTPPSPAEIHYREAERLAPDERLACQCVLLADIEVEVPPEGHLPHLTYSEA